MMQFKKICKSDIEPHANRFNAKVSREGNCWEWQAAIKDNGYGYFRISKEMGMISAHKAAWILANDEVPHGMYICHSCDNRRCCNPSHLWIGSAKQNQMDMASKGRVKSYAKSNANVSRDSAGRFKGN